ncbi:hypothetical protein [Rhodococcus sp. W8901]|uniref:hypothetical protein n=1 Tax=Rhodococcus sp. W8901 TaxID=2742603 RepID=UPI0015815496|nr:hypothetical protein [Rhodococcus sp. W8901]QKT13567.1 hypothetical protein HUN07_25005 [Rhodococcus sp. W8901]
MVPQSNYRAADAVSPHCKCASATRASSIVGGHLRRHRNRAGPGVVADPAAVGIVEAGADHHHRVRGDDEPVATLEREWAEVAELWRTSLEQRRTVQQHLMEALAGKAVDVALVLLSPETYTRMVFDSDWSPERYERWVHDTVSAAAGI